MALKRDDFTKTTKDVLSKRVGGRCSNPECNVPTSGPHSDPEKHISIGIAAHITAASQNGPRYDPKLSPAQRSSIENGIWLCNNCSTLIDRDAALYSDDLLHQWKIQRETIALEEIKGIRSPMFFMEFIPHLEADLLWNSSGKWRREIIIRDPYIIRNPPNLSEIYKFEFNWELTWDYVLVIYNNSSYMAKNIRIENIGSSSFTELESLSKINNIGTLDHIKLSAKLSRPFQGTVAQAEEVREHKLPHYLNEVKLKITYFGENHQKYVSIVEFRDGKIQNWKENQ